MFWNLLFLTIFSFTTGDSEHDKYIDLLPEKEKQEFLEVIARRIYDEIKSKDVPEDSHIEISDEQLDVHSAYVRGVIEQEAENFKNVSGITNRINEGLNNDTQNTQNNKVIDGHIEREVIREKRTNMEVQPLVTKKPTKEDKLIMPVKVVYDIESIYESTTTQTITTTRAAEIIHSTKEHSTIFESTTYSGSKSSSKYNDSSDTLLSATMKAYEEQNYNSDDRKVEYTSSTIMDTSTVSISTDKSIETRHDNQAIDTNLRKKNSKAENLETEKNKTSDKTRNDNNNIKLGDTELPITTAEHVTKSKEINNPLSAENENVTHLPYKSDEDKKNLAPANNKHNLTNAISVNNLKQFLSVNQDKQKVLKSYEVYEIDPESTPFVKSEKKESAPVLGQPYYAPVYNYDPENVYFNPHSRFEPNIESVENVVPAIDEDEMKVLRNRFDNYKNTMTEPPRKNIRHHSMQIKSDNKVDVDYYNGRIDDDRKHPRISNDNNYSNLKHRIRTIRFKRLKALFGLIPLNYKKRDQFSHDINFIDETRVGAHDNYKRHKDKKSPVSFDYYFERFPYTEVESDTDLIKPLTENPIYSIITREKSKKKEPNTASIDETVDKNNNFDYKSLLRVFKDMIQVDNDALVEYDWLKSTVDIRAGVIKIINLLHSYTYKKKIHSKDLELLKYVYFLYKSAMKEINKEALSLDDRLSFNYPKPRESYLAKARLMKERKNRRNDVQNYEDNYRQVTFLFELEDFLKEILFHLDNFHSTITEISQSTTFSTQDWYNDIKRMYLEGASDRQIGAVLLHLTLAKAVRLIEECAVADMGFRKFVLGHPMEVKRAKDECIFAIKVLQELRPK